MDLNWIAPISAFLALLLWLGKELGRDANRIWLVKCLDRSVKGSYSNRIRHVLETVSQWLSPSADVKAVAAKPWGWPLFDATLRLSIFYPVTTIVVFWIIRGKVSAGNIVFLNGVLPQSYRVLSFIILMSLFLYSIIGLHSIPTTAIRILRVMVLLSGLFIALICVLLSMNDIDTELEKSISNTDPVKLTIVWCHIAFLGIFSFLQLFWRKYFFGISSSVFVFTLSVTLSVVFPYVTKYDSTVILFFPLLLSTIFAYIINRVALYDYIISISCCILLLLFCISIAIVLDLKPSEYASMMLLICYGILPILNGVFDYVSIGLTRCLVSMGVKLPQLALIFAIVDLFFALLVFAILIVAILLAVTLIERWNHSAELLGLRFLIAELGDNQSRRDYWWLYLTVFSTLMPTVVHWVVAFWSLPGIVLRPWRTRLAGLLRQSELPFPHKLILTGELFALSLCGLFIVVLLPGATLFWFTPRAVNWMGEVYLFLAQRILLIL